MDCEKNIQSSSDFQPPGIAEIGRVLDLIDAAPLLALLASYRRVGRKGYPLVAFWRAYLCSFLLDLPSTNALIRRLEDDRELRALCGFGQDLPHRTTFNRFISRLSFHRDLVENCLRALTCQLADELPGFGEKVAVDSTVVYTHSNPNRKDVSDPEASWTKKHSAKGKDGEDEWHFGYKYHLVADAANGLPIMGFTTTASCHDSPEFTRLLEKAESAYPWFAPDYVMADKGYDSTKNHKFVLSRNAVPIIAIRDMPKGKLREGIYMNDGTPTCMGEVPMEYVASDPEKRRVSSEVAQGRQALSIPVLGEAGRQPARLRPHPARKPRVEGALQDALERRARVQVHEGISAAGIPLRSGASQSRSSRRHVRAGVSGDRAGAPALRRGRKPPLDGSEGGVRPRRDGLTPGRALR